MINRCSNDQKMHLCLPRCLSLECQAPKVLSHSGEKKLLTLFIGLFFLSIQCEGFISRRTVVSFGSQKKCIDSSQKMNQVMTSALHLLKGEVETSDRIFGQENRHESHIERIICHNLGGVERTNEELEESDYFSKEIVMELGDGPNLVAVTGETGSGKSLLVTKVIDLILGGKASASMVHISESTSDATVEVVLKLGEPHLSLTKRNMYLAGLPEKHQSLMEESDIPKLALKRILSIETQKNGKLRLKSRCEVNGKQVTLKALRIIASPLLTIVDAATASSSLAQPESRMAIIDMGVPNNIKNAARESKVNYIKMKRKREELEFELENRILPSSFSASDDDDSNDELLQHWVDELEIFEDRVCKFQESLRSSGGTNRMLTKENNGSEEKSFVRVLSSFLQITWRNDSLKGPNGISDISNSLYSNLLDFRDCVKGLDSQLAAAHLSCEALTSMSSSESVVYALEKARNHLIDTSSGFRDNDPISKAVEESNELLNELENALIKCSRFMEDDPKGLIASLEILRREIHVSVEDIDELIVDWGSLSRKHGISSFALPSCHKSLQQELNGNVETRMELPRAKEDETFAFEDFSFAYHELFSSRMCVCNNLTRSISDRLPSLGMDDSTFQAQLVNCTDFATSNGSQLGIDRVDFLLLHGKSGTSENMLSKEKIRISNNIERGGLIETVASSGEKARILLAIETDLPGAVGASCKSGTFANSINGDSEDSIGVPPVTVIYDEIDAHVGGRAVVALSKMLSDQTRTSSTSRGTQVITITHCPSLAAMADRHIVIRKSNTKIESGSQIEVIVASANGSSRYKELARMAAGDLATREAEIFAKALLRDGALHTSEINTKLS